MGYADQCAANERAAISVVNEVLLQKKLDRIIELLKEIKKDAVIANESNRYNKDPHLTRIELTVDAALFAANIKL